MIRLLHKNVLFILFLLFFTSCSRYRQQPARAFYFWKTSFNLKAEDNRYLKQNRCTTLYVRLADFVYDEALRAAVPVGTIRFTEKPDTVMQIIPVIFLKNNIFIASSAKQLETLPGEITAFVQAVSQQGGFHYKQVQFDCDWTESTRERYFDFLSRIRAGLQQSGKTAAATIRLHQIKYSKKTGIPPVDRGMLMFYNMGKLDPFALRNSIFNNTDAKRYSDWIKSYPLPLDAALPAFSWAVQIRNNRIQKLLSEGIIDDLDNNIHFRRTEKNVYIVTSSFFLSGEYLMQGDVIKLEIVDPQLTKEAAELLANNLTPGERTIALFDFDKRDLKNYDEKNLNAVFNCF